MCAKEVLVGKGMELQEVELPLQVCNVRAHWRSCCTPTAQHATTKHRVSTGAVATALDSLLFAAMPDRPQQACLSNSGTTQAHSVGIAMQYGRDMLGIGTSELTVCSHAELCRP